MVKKKVLLEPQRLCSGIIRVTLVMCLLLGVQFPAMAYVTVASSSYTVGVGDTQYLSVPEAQQGYVDKAVWACSSPYVSFVSRDDAGALIQVNSEFSGVAIVELVYVEKYLDYNNRTRSVTYYKEFKIYCTSEGGTEPTRVSFSKKKIEIGDRVELVPTVKPSGANVTFKSCSSESHDVAHIYIFNNKVLAYGRNPGTATATVTTTNGLTAKVEVEVARPVIAAGIVNAKGERVFDRNLTEAVETMEKLAIKTLQIKK